MVLVAIVGTGGLRPTLAAIEAGDPPWQARNSGDGRRDCDARARENGVKCFACGRRAQCDFRVPEGKNPYRLTASVDHFTKRREQISNRSHPNRRHIRHGIWDQDYDRFRNAVQRGIEMIEAHWLYVEMAHVEVVIHRRYCSFDGRVRRRLHARALSYYSKSFRSNTP
jgi:hypothetical protein